jgi:hypothetical protein
MWGALDLAPLLFYSFAGGVVCRLWNKRLFSRSIFSFQQRIAYFIEFFFLLLIDVREGQIQAD